MAGDQDWFSQVRAEHAGSAGGDDWFARVRAEAAELPLTRERQAPGTPAALSAGHHPENARGLADERARADEQVSPFSLALADVAQGAGRFSNEHLPEIAATIAGLATAPASVPAALTAAGYAALAGGGAVPVRHAIRRAAGEGDPKTAEELGLEVLTEGAKQGGAQLAGGLVTRGASAALRGAAPMLTKGAERIAGKALGVSDALARKSPGVNIPLEAARVGARVSPQGERALSTQLQVLKDRATTAIGESDAMLRPSDAAAAAQALLRDRRALGAVAADDVAAMEDEIMRFIGDDVEIPVEKMNAIKQWLAERVRPKIGAAQVPARMEAQQALARGAREATGRAVPEAAAANAEMSRLIPVRRAVQGAVERRANASGGQGMRMGAGGVVGALGGMLTGDPATIATSGLLGAAASRAVANPNNQMRAASGLYRAGQAARPLAGAAPFVERAGNQVLPPAFRAALLAALEEDAGPLDNVGQPIVRASTVRP